VRDRDPSVGVIMFTASAAGLERQQQRLGFTLIRKPVHLTGLDPGVERSQPQE